MFLALKLVVYFLLWTLYSYSIHVLAHKKWKHNFLWYFHQAHHSHDYDDTFWPPWHDYFFWFGDLKSSVDVYICFTLPLIVLTIFDPVPGAILLTFHYVYEVFLSRTVLDHNPKITGWITRVFSIGSYHLRHHKNLRCNYSFYITLWDFLLGTDEGSLRARAQSRRLQPTAERD